MIENPVLLVGFVLIAVGFTAFFIDILFEFLVHSLSKKNKEHRHLHIIPVIKRFIVMLLITSGIFFAIEQLSFVEDVYMELYKVFVIIVALISAQTFAQLSKIFFTSLNDSTRSKGDASMHSAIPFMHNMVRIFLLFGITLLVLKLYNIDLTPALASAGVLGVALAFAARDIFSNLFGGVSVFFDKPYQIGDYVILADEYRGEVIEIGMRSTKIRTRDNVMLTVPNSVMVTSTVINETGIVPELRIRIPLVVGFDTDLDLVEKIIVDLLENHEKILSKPFPRVRYRSFEESGVLLEAMGVIRDPSQKGVIMHELIKEMRSALIKNNIHIPYPHREIHMYRKR